MPPIPRNIARIRNRVALFLTDTCILQEATEIRTPTGNISKTWNNAASDVPCRVVTADFSREMMETIGDQIAMVEIYNLLVPYSQTLKEGYRVIVNGKTYSIVGILTELTDKPYQQAIITRELDA